MVCALYQTPPCDNLFLVYYMNEFPLFFCCVFLSMEITPVEDVNMGGGNMKTIEVKRLGSSANVWLMFSNFKKTNKTIARQVQRRVCASYEYYLPKKLFWTDYFGFWTEFNSKWSGSLAFFRKHCIKRPVEKRLQTLFVFTTNFGQSISNSLSINATHIQKAN